MSLLTRTKGYFVVICVLMCGFLLAFSWRLLYNTYDNAPVLRSPSTLPTSFLHPRQFNQPSPPSSSHGSYVVKLSDGDGSVVVKSQNGTKPFTKDEVGNILSKIHELGLSASEVQDKLLSWQQQRNLRNVSSLYAKHQVVTAMPSVQSIKNVNREIDGNDGVTRAPQPVHPDVDSPNSYNLPKQPSVDTSSRVPKYSVNADRHSIQHLPSEQASVITNNMKSGVGRNGLDNVMGTEMSRDRLASQADKESVSRSEENRRQREKHLQFLKEKFELSQTRNASQEVKESTTNEPGGVNRPGLGEHKPVSVAYRPFQDMTPERTKTLNPVQGTDMKQQRASSANHVSRISSTTAVKSNMSLYEELRSKYPVFSQHLPKDDNTPGVDGTQRPDYCKGCFDFNFPTLIDHPNLCKFSNSQDGGSKPVFLLMLISSAPGNYRARTVIRQTWGARCRDSNSTLKCLFVIGLSRSSEENSRVQLENDHHEDILQIGFRDSYSNLTYKTVTSFKWVTNNCYSAKYVMKTDDDMYVNTDLIPIMLQAAPSHKFMGGSCWGSSKPNRDVSSKWFVSLKSFHKPRFPPMCSGTGYIMSMDVLRSVLFASRNVPFFHLEDVYVALCLQKYGVLPVNIMGFSNMFQEFGACHYKNSVMTSHQVPPELLEEFWLSMSKCPQANISPAQLYIIMPYPDTD